MRYKEFITEDAADLFKLMNAFSSSFNIDKAVKDATSDSGAPGSSSTSNNAPIGPDGKPPKDGAGLINFKSQGGQVDPNLMKQYLKGKGLSNNHIAGLLVSIKWESRFKPGAFVKSDNKQGPSGGLFGFHDPKHDGRGNFSDMVRACGGPNNWQTNWQGQLDQALRSGPGKRYVGMHFNTPAEAASWWVINYEKPADTTGQAIARGKEAHRYA